VYVVVLLGIPSALIVQPLGAAGTPAQIIGICMFGWWLASRLVVHPAPTRAHPVKWLMLVFVLAVLASYLAGMLRPIAYVAETNSADRALLSLCAWCGVVLVMADGISSYARLESLLKVVAGGITCVAILGIVQYTLRLDLASIIQVPGLHPNREFGELVNRAAYQRVTATTSHPIEFGVVLSSALPLVIHFARFSVTKIERRRWWIAVGLVSVALPLSVSRSGALGGLIAVVYLFYTWPRSLKLRALAALAVGGLTMSFVVPGLLGTIRNLFLNASSDPSTQGRTADYAPVLHYTSEHPLFGRGIGTFIPSIYRTLDNAYLGILVEAGVVGLLAFLALFVGSGCVAGSVRRHSPTESVRDLGQSLKAGLAVLAINSATFDALGFSMCAGMIFLLVGATASLWTIQSRDRPVPRLRPATPQRIRWIAAAGVTIVIAFGLAGRGVMNARPEYQAYGAVLLATPTSADQSPLTSSHDLSFTASALRDVLGGSGVREKIRQQCGADYDVALSGGSLMPGTDVIGELGPTLQLVSRAPNASAANAGLSAVMQEAASRVAQFQTRLGIPSRQLIRVVVLQQQSAFAVKGRPSRAELAFVILLVVVGIAYFGVIWHNGIGRTWRIAPRSARVGRRRDHRPGQLVLGTDNDSQ